jgi:hypothetical protein
LIGVAREDITPPVGIYARNWGAAQHDAAEGIHRPLYATALTLQSTPDDSPFVLIATDLGWWKTREDEWDLRGGLIEALDLDPARVLINLSHTHSCPSQCREDADLPGGELIAPYLDKVREAVIAATREALASRQSATLEWAYGRCDLARDRDLSDPEKSRIVCGFNPAKQADDTLLVGRVTTQDGKVLAVLANYACHPTTLAWQNKLISPDFVGAFNETVEAQTGALSLFLQGASGELQPAECYTGDLEIAEAHGCRLGHATLATLEGMLPANTQLEYSGVVESGAPLATWQRVACEPSTRLEAVQIEVELTLKDLPSLSEIEAQFRACTDRALRERLRRKSRIRRLVGDGASHALPVWIWRAGNALFVAQINEAYSLFQTELRRRFPDKAIVVMNLTNGSSGYLPPQELYDQDVYQVWQSPYERGGLEKLIGSTAHVLDTLCEGTS